MSENILIACFSLVGTLVGSIGGILASNRLTNYRIEQLEQRVAAHNNLIERTYRLERDVKLIEQHVELVDQDVRHLERFHETAGIS